MSRQSIGGAVLCGAVLLAAVAYGLRTLLGTAAPVNLGLVIGFGLGVGGAALEVFLMVRAMKHAPAKALNVVLGGLGARLLVVMILTVVFHSVAAVHEAAFALSFVGGFLASLPVVGSVSGAHRATGKPENPGKVVHG